ncbi:MAG: ABC transporter permease, partial [Planctomycetota bacterium]
MSLAHYSIRNVAVRRSSAVLTALGIAMTVAVFTGVFALREGFDSLYRPRGSDSLGIFLRPGAQSEGESGITREQTQILLKETTEWELDESGQPLAAAEMFLAVYMEKVGGGTTNVPLRGVQPQSITIHSDDGWRLVEGREIEFGTNEVMVGRPLTERMQNCKLGDTLMLNLTPFQVVGVFEHPGSYGSEVWGDVDRMMDALQRPIFQRVIGRISAEADPVAIDARQQKSERAPMQFLSEREYLGKQTTAFGGALAGLAVGLTVIMGIAAVLGATNTMIASVAARTHEIGVLLAIGFPRSKVFFAFVLESVAMGVIGGVV